MTTANLYRLLRWIDVEYARGNTPGHCGPNISVRIHEMDRLTTFYNDSPSEFQTPEACAFAWTETAPCGAKKHYVVSADLIDALNTTDHDFIVIGTSHNASDIKCINLVAHTRKILLDMLCTELKEQVEKSQ